MRKKFWTLVLMAGVAAETLGCVAGTNGFVVPTIRSAPGSAFAGWEVFSSGALTNNRPDLAGSTRDAGLRQTDTNGFVTGSGNIYNLSAASQFEVSYASRVPVSQVVFQARTLGAELDYGSVKILFDEAGVRKTLTTTRAELDRGTAQGVNVSSKWEWDLAGREVTAFRIEFAAAGPSLSFDSATLDVAKETIHVSQARVDMDRWMYPNNATPGVRVSASAFSVFGEDGDGIETRWAQFLLGWDMGTNAAALIPTGKGAGNYLVQSAMVHLTINRDRVWIYDGTHDAMETFLSAADSRQVADADAGRPVELFGAGFRGGFDAATFLETGPFGEEGIGTRNAYAAAFNGAGALVDVSSNVGKEDAAAFEAKPFAVGVAPGLTAGDLAPTGTRVNFAVDLSDSNINGYFQSALDSGRLRLTASALVNASFSSPNYPQFYTRDNTLAAPGEMPVLDLEVQIAKSEPEIQVAAENGKLVLTWPAGAEHYEVQAAAALAPNAMWAPVAGTPAVNQGVMQLEVDLSGAAAIYRLHRVL